MEDIRIERLTEDNFNQYSLDDFVRHQVVTECWRKVDGEWKLLPIAFIEDWDLNKRRKEAALIAGNLHGNMIDYGAFHDKKVLGYITVGTEKIGTKGQYIQLVTFQVSEPYRGMGVGRKLFERACDIARKYGAGKLYISAHSSKESQAAYKALGCVHTAEIIPWIAEDEPCDVQLEYDLQMR